MPILDKTLYTSTKRIWGDKNFTQIVLHEVVHASFGVGEVIGCNLMHCSEFWNNDVSLAEAWKLFDKYYQESSHYSIQI